jgi:hypothetical protein
LSRLSGTLRTYEGDLRVSEHRSERQRARSGAIPKTTRGQRDLRVSEHRSERQRARSGAIPKTTTGKEI